MFLFRCMTQTKKEPTLNSAPLPCLFNPGSCFDTHYTNPISFRSCNTKPQFQQKTNWGDAGILETEGLFGKIYHNGGLAFLKSLVFRLLWGFLLSNIITKAFYYLNSIKKKICKCFVTAITDCLQRGSNCWWLEMTKENCSQNISLRTWAMADVKTCSMQIHMNNTSSRSSWYSLIWSKLCQGSWRKENLMGKKEHCFS